MNHNTNILNKNIDIERINNPKLKALIEKNTPNNPINNSMRCNNVQYDDEYVDYWDNCYKDGGWG